MRLWLAKNSEVTIREQLVAQIILAIVSNDLKVNQRLPSTRDLARRYEIHANTVSAAYRELAQRHWVQFRKGSGVFVSARTDGHSNQEMDLDQLIARFLKTTREAGYALAEIREHFLQLISLQRPDHFLVIEPDVELRSILIAEIEQAVDVNTVGIDPKQFQPDSDLVGAVPVVLFGHAEKIASTIPARHEVLTIHSASVAESMRGQQRPTADALVAIVSRWTEFLRLARTMLVAAGVDADALSFRDARQPGWQKGLRSATFIITDSLMAEHLHEGCEVRVFRVIAESSLAEIKRFGERFLTN